MASIDVAAVARRARRGYELSRLRRAALGFAPALLLVVFAAVFGRRPESAGLLGAGLFALGTLLLWYGRDLRKAVLPGIGAGLLPLSLALIAPRLGHLCAGDHCVSLCIPACAAGGISAGLLVAAHLHRARVGAGPWLAASALTLLTGAMGCACVGYSGILGMAAGYALALTPRLLSARR
jgi:hypothetical protein